MPTVDALPDTLLIPKSTFVRGEINIPGSKSLANRALLLASLASGPSTLYGMLHSDDTRLMIDAWKKLGVKFHELPNLALEVFGCGGRIPSCSEEIYIENAGTAARFLSACLTLGDGSYRLTGNARMQARPIADLIYALAQINGQILDLNGTGCPPLLIKGGGLAGGVVQIKGDKSSQYISAIMMAAPYAHSDVHLRIEGPLVSRTYVEMTRKIMEAFGVKCQWLNEREIFIPSGTPYRGTEYHIEGDASSASYFFALAAITQGEITVRGVTQGSSQGDLALVDILEKMGCRVEWLSDGVRLCGRPLHAVDVDMNTMSDVAPTLACVALFAKGETIIRNVANMRIKECDRIAALVCEFTKLGAKVREWKDGLAIVGGLPLHGAVMETYDDHRMAMSLALIGLKVDGLYIRNPKCVSKTFPNYFDHLFSMLVQSSPPKS